MIVRDEAAMLDGCLVSLSGQVDEIVVVDTGSLDDTTAIALRHGARLLHKPWTGDFSAARNRALDAATGDWILYIDADERLVPLPGMTLSQIVAAPGYAALRMRFRPRVGYSPYREPRLFRADPRIRFEMRIHERVMPSILRVCESDGLTIGDTDAELQHLGYEGYQGHKHARNLPLLSQAVHDDPDRVFYRLHLGETLAATGKAAEAETALREGLATAHRTQTFRARLEATLAAHALARLLLDAGRGAEALAVIGEALAIRPHDPALALFRARALIDLQHHGEALPLLEALPLERPEDFCDPDVAYDLRIFGEWAFDLIGLARFRLGEYAAARDAWLAAAARSAEPRQHEARAAVAEMKARSGLSA